MSSIYVIATVACLVLSQLFWLILFSLSFQIFQPTKKSRKDKDLRLLPIQRTNLPRQKPWKSPGPLRGTLLHPRWPGVDLLGSVQRPGQSSQGHRSTDVRIQDLQKVVQLRFQFRHTRKRPQSIPIFSAF